MFALEVKKKYNFSTTELLKNEPENKICDEVGKFMRTFTRVSRKST